MSECYVKQVSFKKFFESIGVSSELNADSSRQLLIDVHSWGAIRNQRDVDRLGANVMGQ